ncbi:PBP1b-binding outer membrane lipoprotein LpoB [Planomicrobium sp. HSC-17F08]|nr:PBP1b-binding outer membrane lipoprotein LpoB [Planomicrobium sp. HSC-17F08]
MGKLAMVLFVLFFTMALGGCAPQPVSSESIPPSKAVNLKTPPVDYSSVRVVQLASDQAILIDGTYYEVTAASTFTTVSGASLQPKELRPGDLVFLTASKTATGQLPEKGVLLSLVKHEDETSQRISTAIAQVLENQETGDIIAPEIKSVSSHLVTLQFRDWANEYKYECIVNLKSLAFHVKEITGSIQKSP